MEFFYSCVQLLPIDFGISTLCPLGLGTSFLVSFAELSLLAEAHADTNLGEFFQIRLVNWLLAHWTHDWLWFGSVKQYIFRCDHGNTSIART